MTGTLTADALNALLQQIDSTAGFTVIFSGDKFVASNGFDTVRGAIGDPEHNAALADRVASILRYPPQPRAAVKNRPFTGPPLTPAEKFEAMLEKIKRDRDADPANLLAVQRQQMYELPTDVTYYPMWVSPEQAEAWLRTIGGVLVDGKPVQRAYSLPTAKKYALLMRQGPWGLSPDPIAFSKPDKQGVKRNINGQHRLIAVIMTGLTLPFMVSEGWEEKTFLTLDKNLKRSTAASLFLEGEQFPGPLSQAASTLVKAEMQPDVNAWGNKAVRPDEAAIRNVVRTRPALREAVAWARTKKPKWANANALAVSRCLAAEACGQGSVSGVVTYDLDATAAYFESLKHGGGLNEGDPALAIRRYLEGSEGDYVRKSELLDPAGFQTFLMLSGWNSAALRNKLTRPSWRPDQLKIPKATRPFVGPAVRPPVQMPFESEA